MPKKAYATGVWVVLAAVIALAGFLILARFIGRIGEDTENLADYRTCLDGNRLAVQTRAKIMGHVFAEQGVKHCKTERVKVKAGSEYGTIAKKMGICWDMYLQGKEELFETKDSNFCAFCSVLEFEDKTKRLYGLTKYLSETDMPGTQDKKYIEHLFDIKINEKDKKPINDFDVQNGYYIDTSKKLAVMFVMYKDAYPNSIANAGQGLTTFLGAGSAATISLVGWPVAAAFGFCGPLGLVCGASAILLVGAGGNIGYLVGSDISANWRSRILVTEYNKEKLKELKCTQLEGTDYLKVSGK